MSNIGFILDALILVFLGVTIFYAARLSLFIKSFRDGRNGMQLLIRDLSVTIDKAEQSIKAMKNDVQKSEDSLKQVIEEARFLSDELRFMNESGDSLADRLEKIASRNRELVDLMEKSGGLGSQTVRPEPERRIKKATRGKLEEPFDIEDFEIDDDDEKDFWALSDGAYRDEESERPKVKNESIPKEKMKGFAIFDRDFLDDEEPKTTIHKQVAQNSPEPSGSRFSSRAEQDLYEALQRKRRVRENS